MPLPLAVDDPSMLKLRCPSVSMNTREDCPGIYLIVQFDSDWGTKLGGSIYVFVVVKADLCYRIGRVSRGKCVPEEYVFYSCRHLW